MKYLDPKADLTFKKIFGKHPDLLISLLNALLPLSDDEQIESIEYLPTELVPELYEHKNSIVDVLCKDINGRKFCVEMQMEWTNAFKQRVLFNASKLYVDQAKKKGQYKELKPVYSLNLVNEIFEPSLKEYQHNYKIVCDKHTDRVIDGLYFTFIELPKITPHTIAEKRMAVLWLRFLTEIDDNTKNPPAELVENPEISKALEEVEVSAFTEDELRGYDKFWDIVRTEKTLLDGSYDKGFGNGFGKGLEKGRAEGIEKGRAEGIEKGRAEGIEKGRAEGIEKGRAEGIEKGMAEGELNKSLEIARNLLALGMPDSQIIQSTGIKQEQLNKLKK